MKEIGGYLSFDQANGREYHSTAIALNTAANCLRYLIRAKGIKKIYLPYFLCFSVKRAIEKEACQYEFYNIDTRFEPVFDKRLEVNEYIYIVNYYGQLGEKKIQELRDRYKNIIADNVQAFYAMPVSGCDTLYSCRKWFGVPDGAYLYTDGKPDEIFETDVSYTRMTHVLGRYEKSAQEFYGRYTENERELDSLPVRYMSKLTNTLMCGIDYHYIKEKRDINFKYLHSALREMNKLDISIPEGAFMYPLYIDNGAELKKSLIANKVFVPTLWADVFEITGKGSLEYDMAENIVPLPVDQRYDVEDMKYITATINAEMNHGG